ncbi:3-hydroxyisobutyrate dehydrogenase-like beta-hydroxyacid dehydrogenase [Sphingomonas zeicaulis]|uniref:NAD(P)-dependent oxidoreductase n=1 Tax=Sphingomonas zeicaulis TaxID=1632740 RepID=UPI003D1FF2DA
MSSLAFIGFGEAGIAFAAAGARAYDLKTDDPATAAEKHRDYKAVGVIGCATAAEALAEAEAIFCLVTADQVPLVSHDYAPFIPPNSLWFDMNSVAPETKRAAAEVIEAAGGRYVDVAVLAPVHPLRFAVPLLVSGPHADEARERLAAAGFTNVTIVEGGVGKASAIKMIRSVMVKGLEALTAEWILAAEAACIREEAVAALNASWPGTDWAAKADYNLERMLTHGIRRAAEMDEVVKTLDALGTGSAMTRGTVERQRALGSLGLAAPHTLNDKLAALLGRERDQAA